MIQRFRATLRIFGVLLLVGCMAALVVFSHRNRTARKFPERQPIVFWHMWTGEWRVVIERIVERFNQRQTQYEVIPLSLPGADTDRKFFLSVLGGDPPDCMAQWSPVIPFWASEGVLQPLDRFMKPGELDRIHQTLYPVAWKMGAYGDHLYGLATCLNAFGMFYRVDHFKEAGLDPNRFPSTIEDLDALRDKLDRFDAKGNIIRLGVMDQYGGMFWPHWSAIFGGGFYDWNASRMTVNTPDNLRALTWMQSPVRRYGYDRLLRFNASIQTMGQLGALDWSFISGFYSIVLDGQWRVEQLAKFAPEIEYRTAPCPAPRVGGHPQAGWSNGNFMIIPKGARCPEGAWAFMRFWSGLDDPVAAAELAVWGGWLPPRREVVEAPVYQAYIQKYPQFRTFVDMVASPELQVTPPVPYQNYFFDRVGQTVDSVYRQSITPEQGIAQLERDVARQEAKLAERRRPAK